MLRVFFVLIAQPFVLLLVVSQYGTRYFGQTPYLAKIEFKDVSIFLIFKFPLYRFNLFQFA